MDQGVKASLFKPNLANIISDWNDGERGGEPCYAPPIEPYFKWMRGHQMGVYGYPNDGKGTFVEYMTVLKAMMEEQKNKNPDWRCLMFKPEDMNTDLIDGVPQLSASRIYAKLAWTYTGKCPFKGVAERMKIQQITVDELIEAIKWVQKHFFIIYVKDKSWSKLIGLAREYDKEYNFSAVVFDPFTSIVLDDNKKGNNALRDALSEGKDFAMETDSTLLYVNHPQGMKEVREAKNGPYKVVTQYAIAGGPTWDRTMDSQYSVYRPFRHDVERMNDPQVHLYSLKVRDEEVVGASKGMYPLIHLEKKQRRYYFNKICPITGSKYLEPGQTTVGTFDFSKRYEKPTPISDDDVPF